LDTDGGVERNLSFSQLVLPDLESDLIALHGSEARHLLKSLRARPGDSVLATDGRGTKAWLRVVTADRTRAEVAVHERIRVARPQRRWWLATRAEGARFDWLIEKSVELGAWAVVPLARGAEAGPTRIDRLRRVADAALGQCMAAWGLRVEEARELGDLLESPGPGAEWSGVAWADPTGVAAATMDPLGFPAGDLLMVVGPPGGFSTDSLRRLRSTPGSRCISLGERRLRAETAALAALVWASWTGRGGDSGANLP
jgi:16S rRNA (uracil1498-N3)-methyltransferase